MSDNFQVAIAVAIFLVTYAVIISEKIHRTIISLVGAMLMILFGIISHETALEVIDLNVIGLLVGMMLLVGITKESGVFEYIAVTIAKISRGRPIPILVALSMLTALASGLLDNVTMVLLIVPVTISIARLLDISPVPFVIAEVLLSNIGGAATLIGDPPNMMIGSAASLSFLDFLVNLGPILFIIAFAVIGMLVLIFRRQLTVTDAKRQQLMKIDAARQIKDQPLAEKSLLILALVAVGFVTHQFLHLESATIAMSGAALLLIIVRPDIERVFHHVEWPVIFFFVGLFILVGSLEVVGVIEWIAVRVVSLTGGELLPSGLAILWVSAIVSAFVDNIPFTATMIPIINEIGQLTALSSLDPLWWCLSLGVCLGGNGTIVGASANVVAIGMLEDNDIHVSFLRFMAIGFPLTILALVLSSVYLYFLYLT